MSENAQKNLQDKINQFQLELDELNAHIQNLREMIPNFFKDEVSEIKQEIRCTYEAKKTLERVINLLKS